jgi:hypothetical protein
MLTITLHKQGQHGWEPVITLPSDSDKWDKIDQEWITELFHCCAEVLTIGDTMYQLNY